MNRARPTETDLDADLIQSAAQRVNEAQRLEQAFRDDCKSAGWLIAFLISWIALVALLAYQVLRPFTR